ncbi:DUF6924 domain-containing protein [Streptomyces carminius]|uniref:DUF6924 domain-containing protein n=1 Tax=Streptomyces carminius TaxID=2665496 RepID=UPI0011B7B4C4|nr:hypothetical protein [Streptomyces carminius]
MKPLPRSERPLVVRTDFSSEKRWNLLQQVLEPDERHSFTSYVEFVDDPAYRDVAPERFLELVSADGPGAGFLFVADRIALLDDEFPLVVLGLSRYKERGTTFRTCAFEVDAVSGNLSVCHMGFDEFAEAVDPDGVFRGF